MKQEPSKVTISRLPGERWKFEFSDDIRVLDVNVLQRSLRREYLLSKRRKRMRSRVETCAKAAEPPKEAANAA